MRLSKWYDLVQIDFQRHRQKSESPSALEEVLQLISAFGPFLRIPINAEMFFPEAVVSDGYKIVHLVNFYEIVAADVSIDQCAEKNDSVFCGSFGLSVAWGGDNDGLSVHDVLGFHDSYGKFGSACFDFSQR